MMAPVGPREASLDLRRELGFADRLKMRICSRSLGKEGKCTFLGVAGVLWVGELPVEFDVEVESVARLGVLGAERARICAWE